MNGKPAMGFSSPSRYTPKGERFIACDLGGSRLLSHCDQMPRGYRVHTLMRM